MNEPQLTLDLMMTPPVFVGVNSPRQDHACASASDIIDMTPVEALAQMVVDDRACGLGKTTWKHLLDVVLSTGHVELYESEPGIFGLRKPGYRFGPIARMPAIAVDHVRERLAAAVRGKARSRG